MGGSLGLALLATVATQRTADLAGEVPRAQALTEGFHRAFALGSGVALAGALVSVLVLGRVRAAPASPVPDRAGIDPVPRARAG